MKQIKLNVANKQYTVDVAETDYQKQVGLQKREKLDSDKGMLFIFEEEGPIDF